MAKLQLSTLSTLPKSEQIEALAPVNAKLARMSAQERVHWAFENLEGGFALSSSFGIQAAVMLHLMTQAKPNIPVILTDTGYLFNETYHFIDELTERLSLNLKVFRAQKSPAWQEATYGQLWTQGRDGLMQYNQMNKVEPMRRALNALQISTWFSGLRRQQAASRQGLPVLGIQHGIFKFLPVIDWTNKDVHYYLKQYDLPYHPLWEQGYVSVGDVHTTQRLERGMTEEETRFFGLKRECGLHEDDVSDGGGI